MFPTASKLVASIFMALTAFIVSELIKHTMPEGTQFGSFTGVNTCLGILMGWLVMGKRAGRGYVSAINNGLTGGVTLAIWGLFVQGCYSMVQLAMRHRYDSFFDAILGIFEEFIDLSQHIVHADILIALIGGSIFAGIMAEFVSSRGRSF